MAAIGHREVSANGVWLHVARAGGHACLVDGALLHVGGARRCAHDHARMGEATLARLLVREGVNDVRKIQDKIDIAFAPKPPGS